MEWKRRRRPHWIFKRAVPLAATALLLLAFVGVFRLYGNAREAAAQADIRVIYMTDIIPDVADGTISIPFKTLQKDTLVYFEYRGGREVLPLLAYIGPTGKIITAVGVCEPCQSSRFHIEGNDLFCNGCDSVWNLETHEAVKGGCSRFPPQIIPHDLKDGQILIREADVLAWKPRI